jgi:hypothetical protein
MKKILFTFYFLLFTFYCRAQNLVPNYSFEDTLSCPNNGDQLYLANPWYSPTAGSPDYFNECGIVGYVGIPFNFLGMQNARTGEAYAGFLAYGSSVLPYREYVQVQLADSLIQGKEYCIKFFVNLSDVNSTYTKVAITEIGLLLSDNPITSTNLQPLPFVPQISSLAGLYLSDTLGWMEISGIYTALGGERFVTIGNFKDDVSTDTLVLLNSSDPQAYYYVDDVTVIDCADTGTSVNEMQVDYQLKLYPNPSNGNIKLEYHFPDNETGLLKIYDVTGKAVKQYSLHSKDRLLNINATELQAGVYYYSILVNNKVQQTEKLVIVK